MSLLDDLEQEALAKSEADEAAKKEAKQKEKNYGEVIQPAMASLAAYLEKLCEHLNYLNKSKPAEYNIAGYGVVQGQIEPKYAVAFSNNRTDCSISVTVPCTIDRGTAPEVQVVGARAVKTLSQLIQNLRLAGNMQTKRDPNGQILTGTFQVNGQIECEARIDAHINSNDIRIAFKNFGEFSERVKTYQPGQLTDDLKDQIGRFLAREDDGLLTEEISEEFRKQLRQKLEQQKMRQKWEAKLNEEDAPDGKSSVDWTDIGKRVNRVVEGTKRSAWELLKRRQKTP